MLKIDSPLRVAPAARILTALSVGAALVHGGELSTVRAQTIGVLPDAGQVLRDQAAPPEPASPASRPAPVRATPTPALTPAAMSTRFPVKEIRITGNTRFSSDELKGVAALEAGREVTLTDLYAAANRITEHYQAKGYLLARAYLPPQEIRDGNVEVAVIEGRVGQLDVENRSLVSTGQLHRFLGATSGTVVHDSDFERRLLLIGDLPGVSEAYATLQPGERTGETRMGVVAVPGPRVSGQVDLDNHGNRYTGAWRVASLLNFNSPAGWGDQLQLRALASQEQLYSVRAQYRAPIGGAGWSLGGIAAWTDYQIGREFADLDAEGWARSASLFVSYPIVRSVDFTLTGTLSHEWRHLRDRVGLAETETDKAVGLTTLNLGGYGRTESLTYTFLVAYTHGRVDLRTPQLDVDDAAGRQTQGHYQKGVGIATGTWGFTPQWALYGSLYAQFADRNLDSSERLSLGGATGVRAYPQGESSGDEGYLATLELRYNWVLQPVQLFGFVDAGAVRFNAENTLLDLTPNRRHLAGAGVGVTWLPRSSLALRGMVATRLGDDIVTAEPDRRTRLWLQLLWRY